jgi:hypothetical protein
VQCPHESVAKKLGDVNPTVCTGYQPLDLLGNNFESSRVTKVRRFVGDIKPRLSRRDMDRILKPDASETERFDGPATGTARCNVPPGLGRLVKSYLEM